MNVENITLISISFFIGLTLTELDLTNRSIITLVKLVFLMFLMGLFVVYLMLRLFREQVANHLNNVILNFDQQAQQKMSSHFSEQLYLKKKDDNMIV